MVKGKCRHTAGEPRRRLAGITLVSGESGQLLMIALMVLIILVITIPTVIWLNTQSETHSLLAQKGQDALLGAQGAIANTAAMLSDPTDWNAALQGNFPPQGCGQLFTDPKGMQFMVNCSTMTPSQNYQVTPPPNYQVALVASSSQTVSGNYQPAKQATAVLSTRTLGATVQNNLSASAALVLYSIPVVNGTLDVEWGPIVEHSSQLWTVTGFLDSARFPRKFSEGGITGSSWSRSPTNTPPTTDGKEYWAWNSVGYDPIINEAYYIQQAQNASGVLTPAGCTTQQANATTGLGSGYFNNNTTFDVTNGSNYTVNPSTALYVYGDATFGQIAIDLKPAGPAGAMIVTGNLTLNNVPLGGQTLTNLRVPATTMQEYPYETSGMPCQNIVGTSYCSSADWGGSGPVPKHAVDFRGFLYVKGNLIVNGTWVIVGAVRVDGQVIINSGGWLSILYDDEINHNIQVTPLQLQLSNCVPTFGQPCGSCGGITQCDGECQPGNLNSIVGGACTVANLCNQTAQGTITCNGCTAVPPPMPANYGGSCSASNHCNNTNYGTIDCNGNCTATAPPDPNGWNTPCNCSPNCGCGGATRCDGSCSGPYPQSSSYGQPCGNGGTYDCNGNCVGSGTCSPLFGTLCSSAQNDCQKTNSGTWNCAGTTCIDGSGNPVQPPPNVMGSSCQTCSPNCGCNPGTVVSCSGACSAPSLQPNNYGSSCNSDACGNAGTIQCNNAPGCTQSPCCSQPQQTCPAGCTAQCCFDGSSDCVGIKAGCITAATCSGSGGCLPHGCGN